MTPPERVVSGQQGFAVIEALMAALVLVTGILGMAVALTSSRHLTTTSQRAQSGEGLAEQALETMRQTPYANLKLATAPTGSGTTGNTVSGDTNPVNPNYWVSGANLKIMASWNNSASAAVVGTPAVGEPLVTGTGGLSAGPDTVVDGASTGKVYRYITAVNDCTLISAVATTCTNPSAKRLTVAVVMNARKGIGVLKPIWLSTVVADPTLGS
jgi:Tfp pilus assembly protein PilV